MCRPAAHLKLWKLDALVGHTNTIAAQWLDPALTVSHLLDTLTPDFTPRQFAAIW